MAFEHVLVVGAGQMGGGIAQVVAASGRRVSLHDAADGAVDRALEAMERSLTKLAAKGGADPADVISRVAPVEDVVPAELMIEAVVEDAGVKRELFRRADQTLPPGAVLASNTSSIPISTLADALGEAERVIGTHYLNPPLLMPTVEVIPGTGTAERIVTHMVEVLEHLGKLPVVVRRDVPGFIWNRLQFALVRECVWLVENGVATAEAVDVVVREGLARRWRRVGPMRAIALGGVDTWNVSGRNIVPELSTTSALPDLRSVAIVDGDAAADAAARDAALAAELRSERASDL
jgi:3-hydroxybutyryl-CoA dehydrogenase